MLIDSHAHLDMPEFEGDLDRVLSRAAEGEIGRVVTVGIDLDSSQKALHLAQAHDDVFATVGYHPHNAERAQTSSLQTLIELAAEPQVVAWGEIGLDFYRHYSPPDDQKRIFRRQMEIARELDLPVIIHDREAHSDILAVLKRRGGKKGKQRRSVRRMTQRRSSGTIFPSKTGLSSSAHRGNKDREVKRL